MLIRHSLLRATPPQVHTHQHDCAIESTPTRPPPSTAAETTPNGDISPGEDLAGSPGSPPALGSGLEQTECELAAVRGQLESAESQLAAAHHTITRLREEVARAETETTAFRESAAALETQLGAARTEAATRRDEAQELEASLKEKQDELAKLEKQVRGVAAEGGVCCGRGERSAAATGLWCRGWSYWRRCELCCCDWVTLERGAGAGAILSCMFSVILIREHFSSHCSTSTP